MVEFGFNDIQPSAFCSDDVLEDGAFRFCINSIACNSVVILVSSALIFVDLVRACLTNKEVLYINIMEYIINPVICKYSVMHTVNTKGFKHS